MRAIKSEALGRFRTSHQKVSVDDAEGPPVPIPNTEVKLSGAENTWLATARENREMPTLRKCPPSRVGVFLFGGLFLYTEIF